MHSDCSHNAECCRDIGLLPALHALSRLLWLFLLLTTSSAEAQSMPGRKAAGDSLLHVFLYQGFYDSLGTVDQVARLAAQHDIAVFTHGFYLDGTVWVHGSCLDVNYKHMPLLLRTVRIYNPEIRVFVYVAATADHPNGCWPQPSVRMDRCPDDTCADFDTWTDLWLGLEATHEGITIDGVFVDLVHPALIGPTVRDSLFRSIRNRGKLIMANVLSDTTGLTFAAASPFLDPEDILLIEGYDLLAGQRSLQTEGFNRLLPGLRTRWAALVTERPASIVQCGSANMRHAYDMAVLHGASAFAYQGADLGTQTGRWVYCPHSEGPTFAPPGHDQTHHALQLHEHASPNPFSRTTTIRYVVPHAAPVSIRIYNVLGQHVRTLVHGTQAPGRHAVMFDAGELPSGQYFCFLELGGIVRSLVLVHTR